MPRLAAAFLPPIPLDRASRTPIYRQLTEWFRRAIIGGQLHAGQRVPSTRALAAALGVSRLPVLNAYDQLLAEGYLVSVAGAGTSVAATFPRPASKPALRSRERITQGVPRRDPRISRRASRVTLPETPWLKGLGPFRVGLPALDHFPIATWSRLLSRHARRPKRATLAYGDPQGHLPLRETIAEYLGAFRGVRCEASQVLVTTGSQQGLYLAAQVLLDVGDPVWVEDPVYPGARQALRSSGARLLPIPVDAEGMDVPLGIRRHRSARAAFVAPTHQFPLGVTMSPPRRTQLLEWAERSNAWIVEDDYDSEYRFDGHPLAALQGVDRTARVIYLGTFSKVMFPALRLGYAVLPEDLVPAFRAARDALDTFPATHPQVAMTDFIREGHFARHIRRMRPLYERRRTALVQALHEEFGDRLEVIGAEAGMQLAVRLPPGMNDVALARRAARAGVSARPLSLCYAEPPARGGLILGFGGAGGRELAEEVRRLKKCW